MHQYYYDFLWAYLCNAGEPIDIDEATACALDLVECACYDDVFEL